MNRQPSAIDFSAQFGGRDAAAAVLPHFRLLKSIARKCPLAKFPFGKMAFILRVDGEVSAYGETGPSNLDIYRTDHVSVDIAVLVEDWAGSQNGLASVISRGMKDSIAFMRKVSDSRLAKIDFAALTDHLNRLCERYVGEIANQSCD